MTKRGSGEPPRNAALCRGTKGVRSGRVKNSGIGSQLTDAVAKGQALEKSEERRSERQ
jgi:hypothetical protein